MAKTVKLSKVVDVLTKLGFERASVPGMPMVYLHEPSDTLVLFPHGRTTVPAARVASIRRIVVGRGVTSERNFNKLLGNVSPLALVG